MTSITPGTVTAAAFLITELILAGMEMGVLVEEIMKSDKLTDDQKARIVADLHAAKDAWDAA